MLPQRRDGFTFCVRGLRGGNQRGTPDPLVHRAPPCSAGRLTARGLLTPRTQQRHKRCVQVGEIRTQRERRRALDDIIQTSGYGDLMRSVTNLVKLIRELSDGLCLCLQLQNKRTERLWTSLLLRLLLKHELRV